LEKEQTTRKKTRQRKDEGISSLFHICANSFHHETPLLNRREQSDGSRRALTIVAESMIESVRRNHAATAHERYDYLCTVRRQPVTPIRTGEDRNQSDAHEEHNA
jgi:hypothetical protein